jgi:hypothetical protein
MNVDIECQVSANDNWDTSPRLWVGLLHRAPYDEIRVEGYERQPVDCTIQPLQASFQIYEHAIVRGVGLWTDREGGNPIYWKGCQTLSLQSHTDFAVSLSVTNPEGDVYRPSGLLRAFGVA